MNVITILCDTLRRDHCTPYNHGKSLNQCWSAEQPDWVVQTPNIDRLASRGTTFDQAWCGSTPCMPARRDIYTGRYEFLERGWGPLEDDDKDLPRQLSGMPNRSILKMVEEGRHISGLVTDHFHLWEQGSGNYHMGYTTHEFIRGLESDAWRADPIPLDCPGWDRMEKVERHWRNAAVERHTIRDWSAFRVFETASEWLGRNVAHQDFYLHIDCFQPHEPYDPPEKYLREFWPDGYSVSFPWSGGTPYNKWEEAGYSRDQVRFAQARYAANVRLVDDALGLLLDQLDALNLWENTLVVFTTDHGTYNGDHGRLGKMQTHEHDAVGHIPFIMCHPAYGHGQRREQLVQLVDLYPTTLAATGCELPQELAQSLHGINLLPVLEDAQAPTRDYAICGQFGKSITLTDGDWILHQSPADHTSAGNQPLYWYGLHTSRFLPDYTLGPSDGTRRVCHCESWPTPTWLSNKHEDPNELTNLSAAAPTKLADMQAALSRKLDALGAPNELHLRLALEPNA
ncbi:MAG: sulfatase [Verrucomicrobiota bacterium JB024]|nr:sulfatase [Verrucomicrobiota bacterium JB024]